MSETRTRFLREIAERVDAGQVVEVHLFAPLRQGGREMGVAVVAVQPAMADVGDAGPAGEPDAEPAEPEDAGAPVLEERAPRLTVYRASYRHTLKGPDRGRWELELVAEADAPLLAVDDVVRGVHRRAGEDVEPERLNGEAFRQALVEEPWSARTR